MPVDRTIGADLARQLVDLYTTLERRLAEAIAVQLRAGIHAPNDVKRKLAAAGVLRRQAMRLLRQLERDQSGLIEQVLILSALRGGRNALADMARLGVRGAPRKLGLLDRVVELLTRLRVNRARRDLDDALDALPNAAALTRLQTALVMQLRGTHLRILRWADDVYRQVIAEATADAITGTRTRLQTAQTAWEDLLTKGVTGFVDRSGRHWQLASYVEMATRTTIAQAAVQTHLDELRAQGHDLVIVSNAPQECVRCRPWEGRVLSITRPGARFLQVEHAIRDGELVGVRVAGSVAEAVAAGLMHPNCRHSLSLYLPGVTRWRPHAQLADPDGDKARQQLRALERKVREWKLKSAAALDPAAKARADRKVREYQAAIRDHLKATTGLKRQPHREQIGAAR